MQRCALIIITVLICRAVICPASDPLEQERELQMEGAWDAGLLLRGAPFGIFESISDKRSRSERIEEISQIRKSLCDALQQPCANNDIKESQRVIKEFINLYPESSYRRYFVAYASLLSYRDAFGNLSSSEPSIYESYISFAINLLSEILSYRYGDDPSGNMRSLWLNDRLHEQEQAEVILLFEANIIPVHLRESWAHILLKYFTEMEMLCRHQEDIITELMKHADPLNPIIELYPFFTEFHLKVCFYSIFNESSDNSELYQELYIKPLIDGRVHNRAQKVKTFLRTIYPEKYKPRLIRMLVRPFQSEPDAANKLEDILAQSNLSKSSIERIVNAANHGKFSKHDSPAEPHEAHEPDKALSTQVVRDASVFRYLELAIQIQDNPELLGDTDLKDEFERLKKVRMEAKEQDDRIKEAGLELMRKKADTIRQRDVKSPTAAPHSTNP